MKSSNKNSGITEILPSNQALEFKLKTRTNFATAFDKVLHLILGLVLLTLPLTQGFSFSIIIISLIGLLISYFAFTGLFFVSRFIVSKRTNEIISSKGIFFPFIKKSFKSSEFDKIIVQLDSKYIFYEIILISSNINKPLLICTVESQILARNISESISKLLLIDIIDYSSGKEILRSYEHLNEKYSEKLQAKPFRADTNDKANNFDSFKSEIIENDSELSIKIPPLNSSKKLILYLGSVISIIFLGILYSVYADPLDYSDGVLYFYWVFVFIASVAGCFAFAYKKEIVSISKDIITIKKKYLIYQKKFKVYFNQIKDLQIFNNYQIQVITKEKEINIGKGLTLNELEILLDRMKNAIRRF